MDTEIRKDLLCGDMTYQIIGASMAVYNQLGVGFLEAVYQEAFSLEAAERNIPIKLQFPISIFYKDYQLEKKYIADCVAYNEIIIEFKCVPVLTNIEESQILNYLKATGFKVGLLVNFGNKEKLEWKRFVY